MDETRFMTSATLFSMLCIKWGDVIYIQKALSHVGLVTVSSAAGVLDDLRPLNDAHSARCSGMEELHVVLQVEC